MTLKVPILIGMQGKSHELGRIRVGNQKEKGWNQPRDGFRFTSRFRSNLEEVQAVYGGSIGHWEGHKGQWDLDTTADEIRVIVNCEHSLDQWFRQYGKSGCTHRCDGEECRRYDQSGNDYYEPCSCKPDNRACKLDTALNVVISDVPLMGLWCLKSGGKIFGSEVQAVFEQMHATGLSQMTKQVYCLLGVDRMEIRKPNKAVSKFPSCSLIIDPNPPNYPAIIATRQRQITGGALSAPPTAPQIEAPKQAQIEGPPIDRVALRKEIDDLLASLTEDERATALAIRRNEYGIQDAKEATTEALAAFRDELRRRFEVVSVNGELED